MRRQNFPGRWLMAPALLLAFCSQAPPRSLTGPEVPGGIVGEQGAGVGSSAIGDVRSGPIEIFNVRITAPGVNPFYANPSGLYRISPGVAASFWVEWRSDVALASPPRLAIHWGFAEADNISCGACLLTKTFPVGLHTVTVLLDDRVGGVTRRTFQIDTRPAPVEETAAPTIKTLQIEARVDGRSEIRLQGNHLWWHHREYSAPGWRGPGYDATLVNGVPWSPVWPSPGDNSFCNCDSSLLTSGFEALTGIGQVVVLEVIRGRDDVDIAQQPSAANGFTLVVDIDDDFGGADTYILKLTYR